MNIRALKPADTNTWLVLRQELWPDSTRDDLEKEQQAILDDPGRNAVFVAEAPTGEVVGFIEVSLRGWAEGCRTQPVGYIEGWFVSPARRRKGIGATLVKAAETWALSQGCTEMGSDAETWNEVSQRAHQALGYSEVLRLVCFSKKLEPD